MLVCNVSGSDSLGWRSLHDRYGTLANERYGHGVGTHAVAFGPECSVECAETVDETTKTAPTGAPPPSRTPEARS